MVTHEWDPVAYGRFAQERRRPFDDLMARVGAIRPRTVVDLGCGSGEMTIELARRWPAARVVGIDPSPQMIETARAADGADLVEWRRLSAEDWDATRDGPIDLVVTNAVLQWVPSHLDLLPRWLEALGPGGVIALQVPGNMQAPAHALMREVASTHPRAAELVPALNRARASADPTDYVRVLVGAGFEADAWETTYVHLLSGEHDEHPVLSWVRSTGLRPVQQILTEDEFVEFTTEYERRLRQAYPEEPFGVALPFRRVFAIGRRTGSVSESVSAVVGIDHVQVACAAGDEDVQRGFYAGVLGMTEIPKPPILAARGGAWFASGQAVIHVGVEADFSPARKAHPCLLVPDIDEIARRVRAAGHPVTWDDAIPGIRRFHTHDGVGNRIELQER